MASRRETILAQVATALTGTTGVDTRIFRSRVVALQREEFPAILIEPVSDVVARQTTARLIWSLRFQVAVVVRADNPDQSADDIVVDAHEKIMSDSTLQGMLVELLPSAVDFQFENADKPLGIVTMQFEAKYQTAEADITSV
jgi:hypothetical protein